MIKLNPNEEKMFELLRDNGLGKQLLVYIRRITTEFADVRTMNHDNVQARRDALILFKEALEDKIVYANKKAAPAKPNPYR
jgi:hypothetical protein